MWKSNILIKVVPENCYTIGKITATAATTQVGGIVGGYQAKDNNLSNCYYLESVEGDNTTFDTVAGVLKTKDEFENGSVAYLLQGDQTEIVWGQDLDNDKSPMLKGIFDTKRVRKITIADTVSYLNDGDKVTRPKDPQKDEFKFIYWLDNSGNEYDFDNLVSADVTLTAKWKKYIKLLSGGATHIYDGNGDNVTDNNNNNGVDVGNDVNNSVNNNTDDKNTSDDKKPTSDEWKNPFSDVSEDEWHSKRYERH